MSDEKLQDIEPSELEQFTLDQASLARKSMFYRCLSMMMPFVSLKLVMAMPDIEVESWAVQWAWWLFVTVSALGVASLGLYGLVKVKRQEAERQLPIFAAARLQNASSLAKEKASVLRGHAGVANHVGLPLLGGASLSAVLWFTGSIVSTTATAVESVLKSSAGRELGNVVFFGLAAAFAKLLRERQRQRSEESGNAAPQFVGASFLDRSDMLTIVAGSAVVGPVAAVGLPALVQSGFMVSGGIAAAGFAALTLAIKQQLLQVPNALVSLVSGRRHCVTGVCLSLVTAVVNPAGATDVLVKLPVAWLAASIMARYVSRFTVDIEEFEWRWQLVTGYRDAVVTGLGGARPAMVVHGVAALSAVVWLNNSAPLTNPMYWVNVLSAVIPTYLAARAAVGQKFQQGTPVVPVSAVFEQFKVDVQAWWNRARPEGLQEKIKENLMTLAAAVMVVGALVTLLNSKLPMTALAGWLVGLPALLAIGYAGLKYHSGLLTGVREAGWMERVGPVAEQVLRRFQDDAQNLQGIRDAMQYGLCDESNEGDPCLPAGVEDIAGRLEMPVMARLQLAMKMLKDLAPKAEAVSATLAGWLRRLYATDTLTAEQIQNVNALVKYREKLPDILKHLEVELRRVASRDVERNKQLQTQWERHKRNLFLSTYFEGPLVSTEMMKFVGLIVTMLMQGTRVVMGSKALPFLVGLGAYLAPMDTRAAWPETMRFLERHEYWRYYLMAMQWAPMAMMVLGLTPFALNVESESQFVQILLFLVSPMDAIARAIANVGAIAASGVSALAMSQGLLGRNDDAVPPESRVLES